MNSHPLGSWPRPGADETVEHVRPIADQTVLITGATGGLGRAVADELAGAGATLLLHGRHEPQSIRRQARPGGRSRLRALLTVRAREAGGRQKRV